MVDGNVHVLNEMLSTLKPSTAAEDDLQLLKVSRPQRMPTECDV